MLEPLEQYMTPTLDAALLYSSRTGSDVFIAGPLRYYLNYMPQVGFDPLFAESAQSTE